MWKIVSLLIIGLYCASGLTDEEVASKWNDFKVKFSKNYADEGEENSRRELFVKRLQEIDEHNAKYDQGLVTYKLGVNQFADFTPEEMKKYTHGINRKKP